MKRNCKNCYCLHNNNNMCALHTNAVDESGFCKSMIVLNKQMNHKIYKFMMPSYEVNNALQ